MSSGEEKKKATTAGIGDGLTTEASSLDYDNGKLAGWLSLTPPKSTTSRTQPE